MFVEELCGVLRPDSKRAAEHFCGSCRRREADHRLTPVRGYPSATERAEHGGLVGTSGADQQIERQPRTGDASSSDGLVGVEPDTPYLA